MFLGIPIFELKIVVSFKSVLDGFSFRIQNVLHIKNLSKNNNKFTIQDFQFHWFVCFFNNSVFGKCCQRTHKIPVEKVTLENYMF